MYALASHTVDNDESTPTIRLDRSDAGLKAGTARSLGPARYTSLINAFRPLRPIVQSRSTSHHREGVNRPPTRYGHEGARVPTELPSGQTGHNRGHSWQGPTSHDRLYPIRVNHVADPEKLGRQPVSTSGLGIVMGSTLIPATQDKPWTPEERGRAHHRPDPSDVCSCLPCNLFF